MSDFHFIRPLWLFALLPALFMVVVMLRGRLKQGSWSEVCDAELLPYILQERKTAHSRWPLFIGFLAAFLVILSLAGPTWERLPTPVFRDDSALVIALDLSRSMDAADIKPSRLIRARYKVTDILNQRKEGLTALIAYAGDAFVVTPLTDDTETIGNQLNALKTEVMPVQGSNSLAAIRMAAELLQQSSLQTGDILLISDGVKRDLVEPIAEVSGSYRLSVLGIGTEAGAPIGLPSGGFLKDPQGNIVVPKLDSAPLSELASSGGGLYETITIGDDDIEAIMAGLKRPEADQSTRENRGFLEQWDEKGPWLLLLVLPLAALLFRRGALGIVLLLLLPFPQESQAVDWHSLWQTPAQQGQKAYDRQQYESAAELFQSPERKAAAQYKAENFDQAAETLKAVDTADGHYNRGNALAKAGKLKEALSAYRQAEKLAPKDGDIKYNSKQVEEALKREQQKDSGKDRDSGEKNQESQEKENKQENQSDSSPESPDKDGGENNDQKQSQQADNSSQNSDKPVDGEPSEKGQSKESDNGSSKRESQAAANSEQATPNQEQSESQQANEQWLKRIPDDPAGLLKRKFRYQYGRRRQNQIEQEQAW